MKNILKLTAMLLVLAGIFACEKDDIDWSKIDLSNIENLYAQPLPVIQKVVQGKWKVYQTCGGVVGCVYPENSFLEITPNETIADNDVDDCIVRSYSWKKKKVDINEKMINTYIMWPDGANETAQSGVYFIYIKNDTLSSQSCSLTSDNTLMRNIYIRVK